MCKPRVCERTAPVCNWDCPPGTICTPDSWGECSCEPQICQSSAPACDGECPQSTICTPDPWGECVCKPQVCERTAPVCNGECPRRTICTPDPWGECICRSEEMCEDGRKVTALTVEYNGEGCEASSNDQSEKCSGGANFSDPAGIVITKNKGPKNFAVQVVPLGGQVILSGIDGAETEIRISGANGTEVVKIHTSCSVPLAPGDQFGSLLIVDLDLRDRGK